METFIIFAGVGICALLLNFILMPIIIRIAHKRKLFDLPNGRKIHTGPIPRLGGIGIFLSFLVSALVIPGLLVLILPGYSYPYTLNHLPVLAGFCLICALGLFDDFRSLRARLKFFVQILAGILVTLGGYTISVINIPGIGMLELGIWRYPVTVFWIVGLSNALNFIDGIDGFAGVISSFAALSMGVVFLAQGQSVPALLAFALLGSALSFLVFNAPPARIFMGDCGAYLFGFTLSVLPLLGLNSTDFLANMSAAIILLTIPIIDTAYAIVRRLKKKQSPLTPDKEHIHHKLMDLGLREWEILKIIGAGSIGLSAAAIIAGIVQGITGIVIFFSTGAASITIYVLLMRLRVKTRV
jgi:UDP-GlcNAc:undecaprenyl-phosphate GlcNAc-1-phosphate transferase